MLRKGLRYEQLNRRIRAFGWHKERAMTEPLRKQRDLIKWVRMAEQNGINHKTFYNRLNRGWSIEKAIATPAITNGESINMLHESNRKYPKEIIETAKQNGVGYRTFIRRIRIGWTMKQASRDRS